MLLCFALMISWSKIFTCCPMYVFKTFRYFLTNQNALFTRMQPIRSTEGSSTLVSVARDLSRAFYQLFTLIYLYTVKWFPFFSIFTISRELWSRNVSLNHKNLLSGLVHNWPDKFANGVFTLHRRIFRFVIEESRAGKSPVYRGIKNSFQKVAFQNIFREHLNETQSRHFHISPTQLFLFFYCLFLSFWCFSILLN